MRFKYGGSFRWYRARTWWGFHVSWVDPDTGVEWEYTVLDQSRKPWYYTPILYKGVIKRR